MKALVLILVSFSALASADTLVTVGKDKITTKDFSRKMEEIHNQAISPPPDILLEDMVRLSLGTQEAEKEKIQNDPAVQDQYKHLLYSALLKKHLGKKLEGLKVSETEMQNYYKKNPDVHLAYILVEIKPNMNGDQRSAVKKRAEDALAKVKKGDKPFDEIAREYTDDPNTKDNGGDIGYQSRLTMAPSLYEAAMPMKVGEVKGLVETPFGYHIIKLVEKRDFDAADKRQLHDVIVEEKQAKVFAEYFDQLKKQYKISINKEAMKSLKR